MSAQKILSVCRAFDWKAGSIRLCLQASAQVPEATRKQTADVLSKLDRHVRALAELRAAGRSPELWEGLVEGLLAGSDWCAPGATDVSGGRLRAAGRSAPGTLLFLARPLGGLVEGVQGLSAAEKALQRIRSDSAGLLERLSHICNTDIAAKEVAVLMAGALDRVVSPHALLLCSPRAQLLPLLGQRLDTFFRTFGTLGPSRLDRVVEEHRVTVTLANSNSSPCGIFPVLSLIPEADAQAANCKMIFRQDAVAVRASESQRY